MAFSKGLGHDIRNGGDINFQWVNGVNQLVCRFTQPGQQAIHIQQAARTGRIFKLLLCQKDQRMHLDPGVSGHPQHILPGYPPVTE